MMKHILYLLRILSMGLGILSQAAVALFSGRSSEIFFETEIMGHE